jgi:aminopeptidase N
MKRVHDVRLDGKPVKRVATDNESQLTTVTLGSPVTGGEHTLTFKYSGKIEAQLQGLFARASFTLSATVPAKWVSISNMLVAKRVVHGELATVTFERSPKMPSYLVEFTSGDLADISAVSNSIKFGVWAVRGSEKNGADALTNAQMIIADYNDYFGHKFPLPKLDSIAVPGGFQGAMENWGAIT